MPRRAASPDKLLGGHLHIARDSHITEEEESTAITSLLRLSKGIDLGDFLLGARVHCLRRSIGPSLIFDRGERPSYAACSRSQSPGLRSGVLRGASPRLSQRRVARAPLSTREAHRDVRPSPHFWQPWSPREKPKSPREAKVSPGSPERSGLAGPAASSSRSAVRGRSPKSPTGHSPKSSPSPDTSRSPSGGHVPVVGPRWSRGHQSPRAASPFNPHTDYDVHIELAHGPWHRFETRVGVADEFFSRWPSNCRAKFQLIDEDEKSLLWESSETLEPWAPTELCSVVLGDRGARHLCLRVRCPSPPDGAVWIEPAVTCARRRRPSPALPWEEFFAGEMLLEVVSRLACRDVARVLASSKAVSQMQQAAWHCAFAHSFRQAYVRYFLGPLRKQPSTGIQWVGGGSAAPTAQNGTFTFAPGSRVRAAVRTLHRPPERPSVPLRSGRGSFPLGLAACCHSCRAGGGVLLPQGASEVFDWRQICRRFYLAQLPCASVNFQLFNCTTPNGFVKDSGEMLHVPRAYHGQSPPLRCGWNIQLAAAHFQSQPSAVVPHRSPLGAAGVPPSVATVRGTAGPEPLAMTPLVSEKDSAVILPMALPGQLKLQWTLEVDPGRYLVVVTVGDRHVGFAAHLEMAGLPIFSGEWVEPGSFKSRCVVCETRHGAITLGQHTSKAWSSGLHKDEHVSMARLAASDGLLETMASPATSDSPPQAAGSPRLDRHAAHAARASPPSPASPSADALAKGTRLVSVRAASVVLVREMEKERKATFTELSAKITEARLRVDGLRQALESGPTSQLERELHRAFSKLAELQAQNALKLFSP
ncbi:unnamed protein product [Durusdinium trenchii]|uniref:Uncharacterized protein n=1 Tax=Durusdinium trenchii TaxID=1381693 RepID=A0ABP0P7L3_9DINO